MTAREKREKVDEYGLLYRDQKEIEKRLSLLKSELFGTMPADYPASEAYTLEGDEFLLIIKAAEWKRTILDIAKVIRRVGRDAFVAACTFSLKALDELIPDEAERAKFVEREQTGPRKVEVVKKFNGK